eukprot:m.113428 g.113428  ORF g.113428 m.113428 type:complete len:107 (-) comp21459_c1_seq3:23-343(-)
MCREGDHQPRQQLDASETPTLLSSTRPIDRRVPRSTVHGQPHHLGSGFDQVHHDTSHIDARLSHPLTHPPTHSLTLSRIAPIISTSLPANMVMRAVSAGKKRPAAA